MCSIYCTNPKMLMRETDERLGNVSVTRTAKQTQDNKNPEKTREFQSIFAWLLSPMEFWRTA